MGDHDGAPSTAPPTGDEDAAMDSPPLHPIPCMQGAFEESIMESVDPANTEDSANAMDKPNAQARRQQLLADLDYNDSYTAKWRRKPGAKYHPLWKLVAQIAFGVHLLHHQLAKSDAEVVKILKSHVNEMDGFCKRTAEDFELAIADIQERINYLKLPLEHVQIFDIMLDDRQFRTSIIEGNEKIEHIVSRTAQAMNDTLLDIGTGLEATEEFTNYLDRIGREWTEENQELSSIYTAMRGNSDGWDRCLKALQLRGSKLGVVLVQLGSILNEMSKRAGVASRRSITEHRSPESGSRQTSRSPRPRVASPPAAPKQPKARPSQKPLPQDPDLVAPAVQATLPQPHPIPLEKRFENPREQPEPQRRKPAGAPREAAGSAQARSNQMADLADFFRDTGPVDSEPPPIMRTPKQTTPDHRVPTSRFSKRFSRDKPTSPTMAQDSAYSSGSSGHSASGSGSANSRERPSPSPGRASAHLTLPSYGAPPSPLAHSFKSTGIGKSTPSSYPKSPVPRRSSVVASASAQKQKPSLLGRLFGRSKKDVAC
ncbi:hypothetical protein W97_04418 [Coniosporium apollinis CBS 100218]|uniref:Uncharacterized protein n=1 Tax=Coniosporium apollinis (strain CBS 100218) TaxID=1168221 RepID=R7YU47_CONA1|nr:uncharacterized protein W97_04418 [Coniosporium apollinis CBS 100218]EON65181.1 hypothetical protein W97_04418 [Coniosporium apollinis CBS 100218]